MSLVAFGIRIAAVRAIRAVVWPEFVVEDSPQSPLDTLERTKAPLIAVYTGHDTDRMASGRELLGGMPKVSLAIQIFLPAVVEVTSGAGPLKFDTGASGADTVLDVIARRILAGFAGQAEPWSQLLFGLVQQVGRIANNSYLVTSDKIRTSAREITLECEVIHEPIPGAPPADVFADLVSLMRADGGPRSVAPLADWIAGEIEGPQSLTQADRDRIDLGLSVYAAQRLGILPVVEDVDDDPPPGTDAGSIDEIGADPDAATAGTSDPDGAALPPWETGR